MTEPKKVVNTSEVDDLYRRLVEREFHAAVERLRAKGHQVAVRMSPHRVVGTAGEQAQLEIDGKVACWHWDIDQRRWPGEDWA